MKEDTRINSHVLATFSQALSLIVAEWSRENNCTAKIFKGADDFPRREEFLGRYIVLASPVKRDFPRFDKSVLTSLSVEIDSFVSIMSYPNLRQEEEVKTLLSSTVLLPSEGRVVGILVDLLALPTNQVEYASFPKGIEDAIWGNGTC